MWCVLTLPIFICLLFTQRGCRNWRLLQCNFIIFQHNLQAHHCNCPILVGVQKFRCSVSWAPSQSAIHKQPLPLTRYCGNSGLQSVNLCFQISSSTCIVFTSVLDVLGRLVRSPCTSSLLLLKTLCTDSWHAALLWCHHPRPLLTGSEFFMGKTNFYTKTEAHYKCPSKKSLLNILPQLQVLLPIKKSNAWLTQKLQARASYWMDMSSMYKQYCAQRVCHLLMKFPL